MPYTTFNDGEVDEYLNFLQEGGGSLSPDKLVSISTKKGRDNAYCRWYQFWEMSKSRVDPDQVWIHLCMPGQEQEKAVNCCKAFLHFTVKNSKRLQVSLGAEEKQETCTFNYASSLISFWKCTVMAFNIIVLARQREKDPQNAAKWTLKFGTGICLNRGTGPVHEIITWIGAKAESMGLQLEQSFVKKEAISDDIALLLQVLWRSADLIPCDPLTRVSFHLMLLIGALGGFRPGVLEYIKYKDVCVELVRDPVTGRRDIIATFTIHQNKQKAKKVKKDQKHIIDISLAMHSLSLFCPVSLVIARALAANAFQASFATFDKLSNTPVFENHIQCIRLPWKKELLNEAISPLGYHRFWGLWTRTVSVAGFPDGLRPYSVRVGAGSRLDDSFTSAVRNFLLSRSTAVYERSYQARHLKENLIPILAPKAATDNSKDLFGMLRRSSLRCDELAPIEAPKDDITRWKQERQDILDLKHSGDHHKFTKIRTILHTLNRLQTRENRQQYFDDANTMRMVGQTTEDLVCMHGRLKPITTRSITNEISCSLKVLDDPPPSGQESKYIDLLLKYLDDKRYGSPTCFLCATTFDLTAIC